MWAAPSTAAPREAPTDCSGWLPSFPTRTRARAQLAAHAFPPTPACHATYAHTHTRKPSTCICGTHTCAFRSPRACTLHRVARRACTHMHAHVCARMPRKHAPPACTLTHPAGTLHGKCCSQQPSVLSLRSPPAPGPSRCSVAALLAGLLSSKDSVQWEEGPSEGLRRGKCLYPGLGEAGEQYGKGTEPELPSAARPPAQRVRAEGRGGEEKPLLANTQQRKPCLSQPQIPSVVLSQSATSGFLILRTSEGS